MSKWQDISTAPKDGTSFLAYEGGDIYRAEWFAGEEYLISFCGQPVVYTPDPTHWQPLPEPPEKT